MWRKHFTSVICRAHSPSLTHHHDASTPALTLHNAIGTPSLTHEHESHTLSLTFHNYISTLTMPCASSLRTHHNLLIIIHKHLPFIIEHIHYDLPFIISPYTITYPSSLSPYRIRYPSSLSPLHQDLPFIIGQILFQTVMHPFLWYWPNASSR